MHLKNELDNTVFAATWIRHEKSCNGDLTNISKGRFHSPIIKDSSYEASYKSSLDKMNDNIKKGADPIKVAKLIYKIINTDKPKIKYN